MDISALKKSSILMGMNIFLNDIEWDILIIKEKNTNNVELTDLTRLNNPFMIRSNC